MRVMSFEAAGGRSFGIAVEGGVIDAGRRLEGEFASLRDVLAAGALNLLRGMEGLAPDLGWEALRFLPVIPDPAAKILCVGVNYLPHIEEMGRQPPARPVVFTRFADSLVGHGEPLIRPRVSECFDYEGELAVVIGKRAHRVSRARALEHVAGYSCFNDATVRDYQREGLQWTAGKNFRASGAFGPWMVTSDEQDDPARFRLTTSLNGTVRQEAGLDELRFDIPALIEYCTLWTELGPGDVLVTGTPGGVGAGRDPPLWMKAGDIVEVSITGVGVLRNTVADEASLE
jgi:2-keto-4-pentenoate hydratase/2-oxohepta-3-ene-1,7-dioic acid hydratase in catechol pathway